MPMLEIRSAAVALESADLVGVAVPYNEWAEIRERGVSFRERFLPESVEVRDDVTLRIGHGAGGVPLARVGAATLSFTQSQEGLLFRASLPESRADLREALARRDLDGSVSIGFRDVRDTKRIVPRSKVAYLRDISSAVLDHLSIVERPAYAGATAELLP
tara:strand:- start:74 stop:553 length:480 start_codon:yes stop_codon:yes gene_type:complete